MATEVGRSQRAMRQLVANITHDLKTPLTSIQGFSQAIMDGLSSDPEEHRRMAQVIHEEAEHMNGLVEDLLYLSRIDAGELTLAINDVDLDALVAATSRRTRYQAESGGVRVRLALDGGRVYADGRRLEQVFTNLVDNAIRFAPSGSEVLLRSYVDGSDAVVEVHNGGKPIPANALPHVFDRFFQGDPSRRRGHAGLGLAIVQELVQAHGGKVEVQSSADSGTTFTVRLRRLGPPGFAVPREAKPDGPPVSTEALARG
jgi:signal transduction histidine kinase